jgi:hypothetical protein
MSTIHFHNCLLVPVQAVGMASPAGCYGREGVNNHEPITNENSWKKFILTKSNLLHASPTAASDRLYGE